MRSRTRLAKIAGLCASGIAAATLAVGFSTNANAVANGDPVADGQYAFATKLVMTGIPRDGSLYDSACSAALIAPQWIITAGHCFHTAVVDGSYEYASGAIGPDKAIPYASVTAILGRSILAGTRGYEVGVVEAYQAGTNDIAIAKLAKPILDINPLAFSSSTPVAPVGGDIVRIAGWGSLDGTADKAAPQMQTGQMMVVTIGTTTLGVTGYLPHPDTSACLYDSGAPYFSESIFGMRLVGVESDGPGCPHNQEETIARVDVVASWVFRAMRKYA
jgi:secreted trypsin-like serine protease